MCTYFFIAKECIKKWRGLRDSYMREKKREKERTRSGAGQVTHKPWKYFAVMGFLAPFVEQRATSGNFPAAGPEESQDVAMSQATTEDEAEVPAEVSPQVTPRPPSEVPGTSSTPTGPPRKRGRRAQDSSLFEERVLTAMENRTPLSETEYFFKGLIPMLESLPQPKQEELKFDFYRRVFEAKQELNAAP